MKKFVKLLFASALTLALAPAIFNSFKTNKKSIQAKADSVECTSFAELKAALENPNIEDVVLKNVPKNSDGCFINIPGSGLQDYAIKVKGYKHLELDGDAYFTQGVNSANQNMCAGLLYVQANNTLCIDGSGSLTFGTTLNNTIFNSTILSYGDLTIGDSDDSYVTIAAEPYCASSGKAVIQAGGSTKIQNSATCLTASSAYTVMEEDCAVFEARYGNFNILNGTFIYDTTSYNTTTNGYGIEVGTNGKILKGKFSKIKLSNNITKNDILSEETVLYDSQGSLTTDLNQYVSVDHINTSVTLNPTGGETTFGKPFIVNYSFARTPSEVEVFRSDTIQNSFQLDTRSTATISSATLAPFGNEITNRVGKSYFYLRAKFNLSSYGSVYEVTSKFMVYWTAITIEYLPNGGAGTMDASSMISDNETIYLEDCKFTAPAGKEFVGWEIEGVVYQPGKAFTPASNLTAKAVWKKTAYRFNTQPLGKQLSLNESYKITWSGVFPKGYFKIEVKNGGAYDPFDDVEENATEYTFAPHDSYFERTFVVSVYEGETGSGTYKFRSEDFKVTWNDAAITDRNIAFLKADHSVGATSFVCKSGSDFIIPEYPYDDIPENEALESYEDTISGNTYYVGEKITVTDAMELDPQFGSGLSAIFTDIESFEHVGFGYYVEVPEYNQAPPAGQFFSHWAFDNGIEVFDYMPGDKVQLDSTMIFDPVFKQYEYTVIFNANGGTGEMASVYDAGADYIIPGCAFTRENYDFDGWAVDSPAGDKVDVGTQRDITEDITLYALWAVKHYEVTYKAGYAGPQDVVVSNVEGGSKLTLLSEFAFAAPEGKEFKEWAIGNVDGEKHDANSEYTLNGNITFVAVWQDLVVNAAPPAAVTVFTISFDANGGTGSMDIAQAKEGTQFQLPNCGFTAPSGKIFDAWEIDGTRKAVGETIAIVGDVSIKALWKDAPVTPDSPTTPESSTKKPGLSGGAIAGIVIGSTLVLAVGGFSVFWFVIKKKSFADLVAIFKKK